ncbi:MAG: hypothetical protein V3S05_08395 [Desulfobacterales bacterium]
MSQDCLTLAQKAINRLREWIGKHLLHEELYCLWLLVESMSKEPQAKHLIELLPRTPASDGLPRCNKPAGKRICLGSRADERETPDPFGVIDCVLLENHPAHRCAEQVRWLHGELFQQRRGIVCKLPDGIGGDRTLICLAHVPIIKRETAIPRFCKGRYLGLRPPQVIATQPGNQD